MTWFCAHEWELADKTVVKSSLDKFLEYAGNLENRCLEKIEADGRGCIIFYERCKLCKDTRIHKVRTP